MATICKVCYLITWRTYNGCCAICPQPSKKSKLDFCTECVNIFPTALLTLYGGKCQRCYHKNIKI